MNGPTKGSTGHIGCGRSNNISGTAGYAGDSDCHPHHSLRASGSNIRLCQTHNRFGRHTFWSSNTGFDVGLKRV